MALKSVVFQSSISKITKGSVSGRFIADARKLVASKKNIIDILFFPEFTFKSKNQTFSGSEFVNVTDIFEISFDYDREICQPWVFFKKIKKAHLRIILKFYFDKLLNEQWEQKLKWQADNYINTAFHNLCRILDNCFNPVGSLRCGRRPNSRRFMMFDGYSEVKASVE